MNFGQALEAVKDGKSARRSFWNGRGMSIYMVTGAIDARRTETFVSGVSRMHFDNGDADIITRMPHLALRAADGTIVSGWLASQTDMFADDWEIIR